MRHAHSEADPWNFVAEETQTRRLIEAANEACIDIGAWWWWWQWRERGGEEDGYFQLTSWIRCVIVMQNATQNANNLK